MNRNSEHVAALVSALASQGVTVRPRRFEGWTSEGLIAAAELATRIQVAHYAALSGLSASGRSSDAVALQMAARGFACPRLRAAILRTVGLDDAARVYPHELDLSTGESGDEGFAVAEQIAHVMTDPSLVLPRPMSVIVAAFRRNVVRFAGQLGETPESLLHCVIVNVLCQMFGEPPYHPRAMVTMLGIDPDELDAGFEDFTMQGPTFDLAEISNSYLNAPLDSIAAAAYWSRKYVPAILELIGAEGITDAEMDELTAAFAPVTIYVLNMMRQFVELEPAAVQELPQSSSVIDVGSEPSKLAG